MTRWVRLDRHLGLIGAVLLGVGGIPSCGNGDDAEKQSGGSSAAGGAGGAGGAGASGATTSGASGDGAGGTATGGTSGGADGGSSNAGDGGESPEGGEGGAGAGSGGAGATGAGAGAGAGGGGGAGRAGSSGAGGSASTACGNGSIGAGETCDDGNSLSDDGCSASCAVEPGWTCMPGPPSKCIASSSCAGMNGTECQGDDCCATIEVPAGTFEQGEPDAFSSSVSSFRLDKYEVTVGRFRRFASAFETWRATGALSTGAAAHPQIPGSGWVQPSLGPFPRDYFELYSFDDGGVACPGGTGGDSRIRGDDTRPMNCLTWFVAFAFCIWDGGRLPTEAEWEYAAAGGSEDRVYPWGATEPSSSLAVFGCLGDGTPGCFAADVLPVGSRPDGAGRFGHRDLAGSMAEWVHDTYGTYPSSPSTDYALLNGTGGYRVYRGGSFRDDAIYLPAASRRSVNPYNAYEAFGVRCAR